MNNKVDIWGTLLLLDAPVAMVFGIDFLEWQVAHKFCGMKLIPPGPHLCVVKLPGALIPMQHFWLWTAEQGEVFVKRWNKVTEKFEDLTDADEEQRFIHGVKRFDFDQGLAPYQHQDEWNKFSRHIDNSTLSCKTLDIPSRQRSHDRTHELEVFLKTSCPAGNSIGLIEFFFLQTVIAGDGDSAEFWIRLQLLFSSCLEAQKTMPSLMNKWAKATALQMTKSGDDILQSTTLKKLLIQTAKELVEEGIEHGATLLQSLSGGEDEDEEEDQPVVVVLMN